MKTSLTCEKRQSSDCKRQASVKEEEGAKVLCDEIRAFDVATSHKIYLRFDGNINDEQILAVKELIKHNPGDIPVFIWPGSGDHMLLLDKNLLGKLCRGIYFGLENAVRRGKRRS
jgi:hypothetical protein